VNFAFICGFQKSQTILLARKILVSLHEYFFLPNQLRPVSGLPNSVMWPVATPVNDKHSVNITQQ